MTQPVTRSLSRLSQQHSEDMRFLKMSARLTRFHACLRPRKMNERRASCQQAGVKPAAPVMQQVGRVGGVMGDRRAACWPPRQCRSGLNTWQAQLRMVQVSTAVHSAKILYINFKAWMLKAALGTKNQRTCEACLRPAAHETQAKLADRSATAGG